MATKSQTWLVGGLCLLLLVACYFLFIKPLPNPALQNQITDLKEQVKELTDKDVKREAAVAVINNNLEKEHEARVASEARVQKLESSNKTLLAENAAYRERIKQMPDIEIASEIGTRIGPEEVSVDIHYQWTFSLTRRGGESTLEIFKNAETYFTLSENRGVEIKELNIQIGSLKTSVELEKQSTALEKQGKEEAQFSLTQAMNTVNNLNKSLKWERTKGYITGAVIGIAVGIIVEGFLKK